MHLVFYGRKNMSCTTSSRCGCGISKKLNENPLIGFVEGVKGFFYTQKKTQD